MRSRGIGHTRTRELNDALTTAADTLDFDFDFDLEDLDDFAADETTTPFDFDDGAAAVSSLESSLLGMDLDFDLELDSADAAAPFVGVRGVDTRVWVVRLVDRAFASAVCGAAVAAAAL